MLAADPLEHSGARGVAVRLQRVQVAAHGAGEEHGVLREESGALAQGLGIAVRDVDAVEGDGAGFGADGGEDGEGEGGFAGPGAAEQSGGGAGGDAEGDVVQDGFQVRGVADGDVVEDDVAAVEGPGGGWVDCARGFGVSRWMSSTMRSTETKLIWSWP